LAVCALAVIESATRRGTYAIQEVDIDISVYDNEAMATDVKAITLGSNDRMCASIA
jgi:hypothetical protein